MEPLIVEGPFLESIGLSPNLLSHQPLIENENDHQQLNRVSILKSEAKLQDIFFSPWLHNLRRLFIFIYNREKVDPFSG